MYHYNGEDLINKLLLVQDYDGLDEEAQYAFREMQSSGNLSSSTTFKDRFGNLNSKIKNVRAHFASMMATTRTDLCNDTLNRSIILAINESESQTENIIKYQNEKIAGNIDQYGEEMAKQTLRNCMRVLLPYEVKNPFASSIRIPVDAKMLRRLNQQFQGFVAQIALLHQYQRKKDKEGRIIAQKEDIVHAIELFFNPILFKVDELDNSTRTFFEKVKQYVRELPTGKTTLFTQRDIRHKLNLSKTTAHKYIQELQELEYIQVAEGSKNRGYKYRVSYWDDLGKLKDRIKKEMISQLKGIKSEKRTQN